MDEGAERTAVAWREFGSDAFAEAERAGKPLLLAVTAPWCDWCRRMDEGAYADPRLAGHLDDGFVPVRVDADRHPRVRERYNAGGFPSTVFLTPGGRVLSGATYLEPEGLRQVLDRVRETWDARDEQAGQVPRVLRDATPPAGEVTDAVEANIAGQLEEQYDSEHAGWGTDAKFPLPRTVEFALKRDRERALRSLDAVDRHLQDGVDGGFFRHAGARDWSDVRREKLLDVNADLLRANAHAYLVSGEKTYREAAARTTDYLVGTLWTGAGFGGSQCPGEYYELPPEERREAAAPPIDDTVFADRNALVAEALLWLYAYTDDARAREYAERALDALDGLVGRERDGDGADAGVVAHHAEAPAYERAVLADQAAVLRAYTAAAQVIDPGYIERARTVADATLDRLTTESGALADGPAAGPGLFDRPLYPLDDNAALADGLVDLSYLTGEATYREAARAAVGAFAGAADRMGVQVAAYGTAAARLVRPPLRVAVADDPGSDLHRAALRLADHEKVVRPAADGDPDTARVHTADGTFGPAAGPAELADLVAEHAG
jgi:uncharacterized protein YyaL (SSP411 family)